MRFVLLLVVLLSGCVSIPFSVATPGATYEELVKESQDPAAIAAAQDRAKIRDSYVQRTGKLPSGEEKHPILSVTGSRELAVGCQLADMATTVYALSHGAVEANPLMAALGVPGIIAVKLLLAYLLWVYHDDIGDTAMTVVNAITCGVAVHNIGVIGSLP